jgi:hypothetical protein
VNGSETDWLATMKWDFSCERSLDFTDDRYRATVRLIRQTARLCGGQAQPRASRRIRIDAGSLNRTGLESDHVQEHINRPVGVWNRYRNLSDGLCAQVSWMPQISSLVFL